ncbi:MAG: glycosyltransferase family 4 protein [Ignavibacteriales bacterium]|nr:glycosyltransferase family 4 protein [Ignavibacteriales bacterium]
MKICFVTDSYPPNIGGAEIVIQNIVEGVAKHGIETIVITTRPNGHLSSGVQSEEKNIIRIKIPKFLSRFWFLIFSISQILRHAKDADLIHGTSYGGIMPTFIAGKLLHKPIVLTIHEFMGNNWFRFGNNYFSALFYFLAEKIFARLSFSKFVAVSNYTENILINAGIKKEKVTLIYNGESFNEIKFSKSASEIRNELGIQPNDLVFAAYGRTGLTKGFEYLVDSIPLVLNEISNAIFLLILTKDDKKIWNRITAKINRIDKKRIIFFTSLHKGKLFDYLNAADVIIIPSLSEGFGYTTLEAVKMNKNIVATKVGAIPEVISGKYIFVEPQSAEAIKSGCIKAFKNEYVYKEPIIFKWENSINSYVKLYKEIIN